MVRRGEGFGAQGQLCLLYSRGGVTTGVLC